MKTYLFISKNSSLTITLSADNEEEAQEAINTVIIPQHNDFRMEEVDDEEDESF